MSLIENIRSYVTPEFEAKAAAMTNESRAATHTAILGGVPAGIAGFAQAASSEEGAARLLSSLKELDYGRIFASITSLTASDLRALVTRGEGSLQKLFGDKVGSIVDLVAKASGVQRSSATAILGVLTPLVGGFIGREVETKGLDAQGLRDLLMREKPSLAGSPLAAASGLGLGSIAPSARGLHPPEKASAWRYGLLALVGVVLIAGLFALRGRHGAVSERATAPTAETRIEVPRPEPPVAKAPVAPAQPVTEALKTTGAEIKLPGGAVLAGGRDSTGAEIALFLASGSKDGLPKRFSGGDLNFEFAKVELVPSSHASVDALAQVLKAYPTARVRLEGNTDSVGDRDVNIQLATNRASMVRTMLIQRGVDGSRIETTSSSEDNPIASNDSNDGRAKNRRVDVIVLNP